MLAQHFLDQLQQGGEAVVLAGKCDQPRSTRNQLKNNRTVVLLNEHGHKLVTQMNDLGILIDIAHGTEAVQSAVDRQQQGASGRQP